MSSNSVERASWTSKLLGSEGSCANSAVIGERAKLLAASVPHAS